MKLLVLGCKTLREGVVVSAIFFIGGLLLTLAAQHVMPEVFHLNLAVLLLGFVLLLLAPIILISTFLLAIFADRQTGSDQCDH